MFQNNLLIDGFSGLVGFEQTTKKGYDRLDNDLLISISGFYVNSSTHPLIQSENISALVNETLDNDFIEWDVDVKYKKNEVVKNNNKIFIAKIDNTGKEPKDNNIEWQETTFLSNYLRKKYNHAVSNLFTSLFSYKKLHENSKTLLSETSLYDGVGNYNKLNDSYGRFVGFAIRPNFKDVLLSINYIGLQFNSPVERLPIYIYHSSQKEPIKLFNLIYTKTISFEWKQLSETLNLSINNNELDDAGVFYIGYYEDDLGGVKSIWKEQYFNESNCSSCNQLDTILFNLWSRYFDIQPFYIDEPFLDNEKNLFDESKLINIDNNNWGMNIRVSAVCDLTNFIIRNRQLFASALRKQVAFDLLNDMAFSTRTNYLKEEVKAKAMYAINGSKDDVALPFAKQLEYEIKNISFDLSGLSHVCLPCDNQKNRIKINSIF